MGEVMNGWGGEGREVVGLGWMDGWMDAMLAAL